MCLLLELELHKEFNDEQADTHEEEGDIVVLHEERATEDLLKWEHTGYDKGEQVFCGVVDLWGRGTCRPCFCSFREARLSW